MIAILGLASTDMDTDGVIAAVAPITKEQALKIESLITDHDLDMGAFMAWLQTAVGVEHIAEIPSDVHRKVIRKINTTIEAKKTGAEVAG